MRASFGITSALRDQLPRHIKLNVFNISLGGKINRLPPMFTKKRVKLVIVQQIRKK